MAKISAERFQFLQCEDVRRGHPCFHKAISTGSPSDSSSPRLCAQPGKGIQLVLRGPANRPNHSPQNRIAALLSGCDRHWSFSRRTNSSTTAQSSGQSSVRFLTSLPVFTSMDNTLFVSQPFFYQSSYRNQPEKSPSPRWRPATRHPPAKAAKTHPPPPPKPHRPSRLRHPHHPWANKPRPPGRNRDGEDRGGKTKR